MKFSRLEDEGNKTAGRAGISTHAQMNHSFIHLARTLCAVPETQSDIPPLIHTTGETTKRRLCSHINASTTGADVHHLAFTWVPIRLLHDNQHRRSVAMLT